MEKIIREIILVQEEPRGPSQLIEIPISAGQSRITLPDFQQLRSNANTTVVIKGMRLIPSAVLSNAVTIAGAATPDADLLNMTIVIKSEGWEKGQNIPVIEFNDFQITGGTLPNRYKSVKFNNWVAVDWSTSYIQFSNGTVASVNSVLMFDVEYIKLDANGRPIQGPQ